MYKILIAIILTTVSSANIFAEKATEILPRIFQGTPIIGDIVKKADRKENKDKFHTHESGVFYENVTANTFSRINFEMQEGSMRKNLENLAKKYGWALFWEMNTDYDIPVSYKIKNRRLPEVFAETTLHLPIRAIFYSRNKVITVLPMYDKRETDVGNKYSINPRG